MQEFTRTYDIHGKVVILTDIRNPDLDAYMHFQFHHFLVDDSELGKTTGARIEIKSEKCELGSALTSCRGNGFEVNLFRPKRNRLVITVSGKAPKMLLNKFIVLALRLHLAVLGYYVCHAAAFGDDFVSDLYFGKGGSGKTGTVVNEFHAQKGHFIHSDDYCFVSAGREVLAFPRYFSVKSNNFTHFSAQLSAWQRFKFGVWASPAARQLLRLLPGRFGQAPVVHVPNFTYPPGKESARTKVRDFKIIGDQGGQLAGDFVASVNYSEFTRDFLDKKRFARFEIIVSTDVTADLLALTDVERVHWTTFMAPMSGAAKPSAGA